MRRGSRSKLLIVLLGASLTGSALVIARPNAETQQHHLMGNLRQIANGVIMYCNENRGWLPQDLGQTAKYVKSTEAYITPANPEHPNPSEADKLEADQRADWIKTHSDLSYAGGGMKITKIRHPDSCPILVTRPQLDGSGMFVAFADGHVEHYAAAPLPPGDADEATNPTSQPSR